MLTSPVNHTNIVGAKTLTSIGETLKGLLRRSITLVVAQFFVLTKPGLAQWATGAEKRVGGLGATSLSHVRAKLAGPAVSFSFVNLSAIFATIRG
jgi:hypothetical protein